MDETIEETDDMSIVHAEFLVWVVFLEGFLPFWTCHPFIHHLENFDLVIRRLQVVRSRLLNLEGYVVVILEVFCEPHCRKVSPAELLDDHIAIYDDFSDMHRVVPTSTRLVPSDFIVFDPLVLLVEIVFLLFILFLHPIISQLEVIIGRGRRQQPVKWLGFLLLALLLGRGLFTRLLLLHFL